MNSVKSLILGSAAALVAVGGAQAADLPVKAKAVEYVKVCSLYGPGFYFIVSSWAAICALTLSSTATACTARTSTARAVQTTASPTATPGVRVKT